MRRYVLMRLAAAIPVLVGASMLVFLAVFALPGDTLRVIGGQKGLPEATQRELAHRYRLDRPIVVQYAAYMGDLARGNLGESVVSRRPVRTMILETLPNTLRLTGLAAVIELVFGVGLGVLIALRGGAVRATGLAGSAALVAAPPLVLAFTLQYLIGVRWHLLPVSGTASGLRSYLMPAAILASASLAYIMRLTSGGLQAAMREAFVPVALAKGLTSRRVVIVHALRNAIVPVITFVGADIGFLLGGAILIETVFNINGVGLLVQRAISQRDTVVVVGTTMFFVAAFIAVTLAVDLLVAALDPRIRYDGHNVS